eukprot:TRINITY_DN8604_c0_g1_i2.p1 TRINITY_DN8604_c0_g1~~TRINITY_DN8604_c0_g1_i2.p1  ORF type:complete len:410 (-),score=57.31 TRINITY_DN8604_c0_g1_i2:1946-3142(-)
MVNSLPVTFTSFLIGVISTLCFVNFMPFLKISHSSGKLSIIFGSLTLLMIIILVTMFPFTSNVPWSACVMQEFNVQKNLSVVTFYDEMNLGLDFMKIVLEQVGADPISCFNRTCTVSEGIKPPNITHPYFQFQKVSNSFQIDMVAPECYMIELTSSTRWITSISVNDQLVSIPARFLFTNDSVRTILIQNPLHIKGSSGINAEYGRTQVAMLAKKCSSPQLKRSMIVWMIGFVVYITIASVVYCTLEGLPTPLSINSSATLFSEDRAKVYLNNLLAIGPRPATSFENRNLTVSYLLNVLDSIKNSSSVPMEYHVSTLSPGNFENTYWESMSNILVLVPPSPIYGLGNKEDASNSFVLLSAHYDTVAMSVGASDSSGVAVMLEVLRAITAHKFGPRLAH